MLSQVFSIDLVIKFSDISHTVTDFPQFIICLHIKVVIHPPLFNCWLQQALHLENVIILIADSTGLGQQPLPPQDTWLWCVHSHFSFGQSHRCVMEPGAKNGKYLLGELVI